MSGVHLELDAAQMERMVHSVNAAISAFGHGAALEPVGSLLESQTRRRINDEKTAPDGTPWDDWSESHARTRHDNHSLLVGEGDLLDSIRFDLSGDTVAVGSNLVYAAAHQMGADFSIVASKRRVTLPARPFLGLSRDNEKEIIASINKWLAREMA